VSNSESLSKILNCVWLEKFKKKNILLGAMSKKGYSFFREPNGIYTPLSSGSVKTPVSDSAIEESPTAIDPRHMTKGNKGSLIHT
jgi:hypothetical protein